MVTNCLDITTSIRRFAHLVFLFYSSRTEEKDKQSAQARGSVTHSCSSSLLNFHIDRAIIVP